MKKGAFLLIISFVLFPKLILAETFTINSCPAETDLFEHMSDQIDDRIEGVTSSNSTKAIFSTRGNLTSPWVRSSTVWTKNNTPIDWTGMSPWNSRGGYTRAGTLITPRHIALANHYLLSIGDTVLFVDNDNNIITRTVTDVSRVLSTDISIAKLNSDVPSSITYYPIIDKTDFEKYLNDGYNLTDYSSNGVPIVVFDQEDHSIIKETGKQRLFLDAALVHTSPHGDRYDFDETIIPGDSGNPGFVLIGDKPALILTHTFPYYGPTYPYYKEDIQNVIDSMGGNYELSTIDFSCFHAPIVLDENSQLFLEVNSPNGTSLGTIDIKYNVDSNTPIFSIISGNDNGALAIGSSTGEITVANQSLINSNDLSTTVEIGVEDIENGRESKGTFSINFSSYPYFNSLNYEFDIDENSNNSTVIGTVSAADDEGDTLSYSIVSGNDSGVFAINSSTGAITVANSSLLDYESVSSYDLVVKVEESETVDHFSAQTEVSITVNDLSYGFDSDSYIFEIDELDDNGTSVGTISASNLDSNDLSEIYYQITVGNTDGIFEIDSSTGEITIADNTNLDGNDIYNLVIGVSDGSGNSVLKSIAVTIQVTMDSRPTLTFEPNILGLVSYTVAEGSSITINFGLSDSYPKSIVANLSKTSGSANSNDYSLSTTTLTFFPGETTKTVTLSASTDSSSESNETILLNIIDNMRVTYGIHKNAFITITNVAPTSSGGGGGGGGGSSSSRTTTTDTIDFASTTPAVTTSIIDNDFVFPTLLPTTIEGLTALLHTLQAQLAQITGGAIVTSSSLYIRNLEEKSEGKDVRQLQEFLISRGYIIPAGATGYFGRQTKKALIEFQRANKITPAVGYFGPITREFVGKL